MTYFPTTRQPQHQFRRQALVAYLTAQSFVQGEISASVLTLWYGFWASLSDRFASAEDKQYACQLKHAIATDAINDLAALEETATFQRPFDRALDSNSNTPLHVAAMFDRANIATWLLARNVQVDTRNAIAYTPLHEAVLRGSLDLVQLLLDAGANPNVRALDGETPLSLACAGAISLRRDGRISPRPSRAIVERLLDYGARIDVRGRNGLTPLHEAACPEQPEAIALLLERGANINARDAALQTPLHYAVTSFAVTATQLLVTNGADLWARDMVGFTPLDRARQLLPPSNENSNSARQNAIERILKILQTYPTIQANL